MVVNVRGPSIYSIFRGYAVFQNAPYTVSEGAAFARSSACAPVSEVRRTSLPQVLPMANADAPISSFYRQRFGRFMLSGSMLGNKLAYIILLAATLWSLSDI